MAQANATSALQAHHVRVNGLNMYYGEQGSGDPLILLHGGSVTADMWELYISHFAEHFRVIAPDSRGHGRTDNPTGELSYRLMADDVAALVRALGLDKPLVCGYSDGGQIALEIGMRYPGLTRALVVGAAWYKFSETYLSWVQGLGFEARGVVNFQLLESTNPGWVDHLRATHSRSDDPEYWRSLLKQLSVMWLTPLDYAPADFERIIEPTLILVGDRDELIPAEQALEMYRLIADGELAILPNATHMGGLRPEPFTGIVLEFLLRHSASTEPE